MRIPALARVFGLWALGLLTLGAAHAQLNHGGLARFFFTRAERALLVVGHLPVTCHLTCPVTSWVTRHSSRGTVFQSRRFTNFAAMTEALQAGELQAAFVLAPLAMTMRRRGVPLKIVYLGHRDGTTLVVRRDGPVHSFADLRGRRIAIPHRYSNQHILVRRMMERFHMGEGDLQLVEFPPPEMPAGLRSGAFDAFIVGEPGGARTELDGFGRVLYYTRDIWPDFISCVLVVSQPLIDQHPDLVQELVDGIARSGHWLDAPGTELTAGVVVRPEGVAPSDRPGIAELPAAWPRTHRMQAAALAARPEYYNQSPELLRYVLSHPADRVRYVNLRPARPEFETIQRYAEQLHFFEPSTPVHPFGFDDYVDPRFAERAPTQ